MQSEVSGSCINQDELHQVHFVSSSEKKQDFMHNAFIVLTPALIVPNNALQPKRKATLDASASGNSSIC